MHSTFFKHVLPTRQGPEDTMVTAMLPATTLYSDFYTSMAKRDHIKSIFGALFRYQPWSEHLIHHDSQSSVTKNQKVLELGGTLEMTFPREDQNCEGFVQGHGAGGRQNKMIIYNSLHS